MVAVGLVLQVSAWGVAGRVVGESAREIPVAYDVDVVVVGGSTGAVAAAVEAARNGAKVFLAAPRPYLGEDVCATYRLWLAPGEKPATALGKALFAAPAATGGPAVKKGLALTYRANKRSAAVHKDTPTPSLLTDGRYSSAAKQSVQYDGDVTITAELSAPAELTGAQVLVYQRDDDFEVASVAVAVSEDGKRWTPAGEARNKKLGRGGFEAAPIVLAVPLTGRARYVKLDVRKGPRVGRVLLAEIIVEGRLAGGQPGRPTPAPAARRLPPTTPMHVKRTLDRALLDAGVQFLFGCYATDVLFDGAGRPAGIVMANRAGRQAVRAKVIVDGTGRATVARLAGAAFRPYPAGPQTFKRIVVGGRTASEAAASAEKLDVPYTIAGEAYDVFEYTLTIPMPDATFGAFAAAEQIARDATWHDGQVASAEELFRVPPDAMKGRAAAKGAWPGAGKLDLAACRAATVDRLYVLGGCADVSRESAERLLRPLNLMALGTRVGRAAAAEAKAISALVPLAEIRLTGPPASAAGGDVREALRGPRPSDQGLPTVTSPARGVPVLGTYDVVVIGGGTGGAPAGIGAARRGARTLVVEYLHGLGGVGTLGLIARYYHGNRVGFTAEADKGIGNRGGGWNVEKKMQWYRSELRKAGADVWFGALGCGALVENGRVRGAVVATPLGRGVVLANTVIDSTGNATIAAAAGAACQVITGEHISVQGTGLPPLRPGAGYTNTDWTFHDDDDMVDMWRMFVVGKTKYASAYDMGQLIDTRARRRIIGDVVLSPLDIQNRRTFPDSIVLAASNFDNHGFSSHPVFIVKPPDRRGMTAYVPYRCLLPKGLDGILVTGLGMSAHGDAMPVLRMQPDVQNQGYAAGVAAAMAAETGVGVRRVDVKALQKHLVEKGNLPKTVLTDKDSYPLSREKVAAAVRGVANGYAGISVILAQPADAIDLLVEAHNAAADPAAKLAYAHILGILHDPTGAGTLAEAVRARSWDKGWNFRGMGQFGATTSPLDNLIISLGRTRDSRGLPVILAKLAALTPASEFSHHRAVAMALETLGERRAAAPLAKLLSQPGMTGHAFTEIGDTLARTPASRVDNSTRNNSLRELILARALFRCGDHNGLARGILRQYAQDFRGHYARHAKAILAEGPGRPAGTKR